MDKEKLKFTKNEIKYKYGEGKSWSTVHKKARKIWEDWWRQAVPVGYLVHHSDGNSHNNIITNLALVTYSYHTNHHQTKETFEKMRQAKLGRKRIFSIKHRKKLSQIMENRWQIQDYRRKMSNKFSGVKHPFFGKHHSEETKIKMRKSHQRRLANA